LSVIRGPRGTLFAMCSMKATLFVSPRLNLGDAVQEIQEVQQALVKYKGGFDLVVIRYPIKGVVSKRFRYRTA